MKRISLGRTAACLLCLCLLLAGCGSGGKAIRFGTAGVGGNYHTFGQTFAGLLSSGEEPMEVEVKVTAGSAANLRLMSEDYIRLAISQTDVISAAWNGTDAFSGKALTGYGAVAGLYTEVCQFVTRRDSGIRSIRDLKGKKVSVGEAESGSEVNAVQILLAYGLNEKLVEEVNLNYTDAAKALQEGEIDAFFCTAGVRTTVVEELARQVDIRLLPVSGDERKALIDSYDFYTAYTVPAGTYSGQNKDVKTVGVKAVLLASNKLSEGDVKKITAALFKNADQLQLAVPVDFALTEENAVLDIPIPFHPGAAAYYEEAGVSIGK